MTLRLAVRIEGDASGLKPAAQEAKRELQGIGVEAAKASEQVDRATSGRPRDPGGRFLPGPQPVPAPATPSTPAPATPAPSNVIPFPTASARAAASGMRPDQWRNLSLQANDAVTMLASGSSVMQVLATQTGQVVGALQDGPGGLKGALREVGSTLLGLATPGRVAFAVVAAGVASAVAGLERASSKADELNKALRVGAGLSSGISAADVGALSRNVPGMSRSDARSSVLAYAGAGASRDNTAAATSLTPGLAQVMYEGDVGSAQKALSDAMRGGTGTLLKYVDSIRPLSTATSDWIQSIRASKGEQAANAELLKILNDGIKGVGLDIPLWRQALTRVGDAAGSLADAFLREAAARANATVQEAQGIGRFFSRWGAPREDPRARPPVDEGRYGRPLTPLRPSRGPINIPLPPDAADVISGSLAELQAQLARGIAGTKEARGLNDTYDNDAAALRRLNSDLAAYDRLLKDTAVTSQMTAQELEATRAARERVAGAINSRLSAEEKARQSEELTIRSIQARTVAEKAAIAAQQERNALANQAISSPDRERRIKAASDAVYAQSNRDADDRLRAANDGAATAGLRPYERQVAQLEQRYRDIFRADAGNDNAQAKNRAAMAADRSAIDAEAMGGPLRDANRALEEQAAALRVQQASMGASTEEAGRLAAAQLLLNRYIAAGVPITAELKQQIDTYAASAGRLASAEEATQRQRQRVAGSLDDLRSGQRGLLSGAFSDLRQGRNVGEGVANQLGSTADRLFERLIAGPATEAILGADGKAGGGFIGNALAAILGGGRSQAVSTATISASTVILTTGSIGGIGDVLAKAGLGVGAGSGKAGFGLGGAQSAGAAAPVASGLNAFGLGGPALGGGSASAVPGGPVPGRIFSFFRDKALSEGASAEKANWIGAAMVGQGGAESSFNPLARGDGGKAFGLFQWNDRAPRLFSAIGGRQNLGDVDAQLRFAGSELSGSESRAWSAMMNARDFRGVVRGATSFERPSGWSWANPEGGHNWAGRLRGSEDALAKFGSSNAATATPAVDTAPIAAVAAPLQQVNTAAAASAQSVTSLAGGLTNLPGPLSQVTQGLSQLGSQLSSGLSSLFGGSGNAAAAAAPANADGGLFVGLGTGRSDSNLSRISNGEFIVNAASTAKHLPLLEAINDNGPLPAFADGGRAGRLSAGPGPVTAGRGPSGERPSPAGAENGGGPLVENHIHNNAGVEVSQKTSRGERGQLRIDTQLDRAVADSINRPGSASSKALRGMGLKRPTTRR